jgi:hypothetical protein
MNEPRWHASMAEAHRSKPKFDVARRRGLVGTGRKIACASNLCLSSERLSRGDLAFEFLGSGYVVAILN